MHNLTKIKIFRLLLATTRLPAYLLLYPLALLRPKSKSLYFFLFDRFSLGGAQRVHLDILHSIEEQEKEIFFTRQSPDSTMKAAFEAVPHAKCRDIHFWCDNLLLRLFSVHYWAFYINRHKHITLLSANSTFFYDLLPHLHPSIRRMELLHNFTYGKNGMEFFGLANHTFLDKRLTVDYVTAQNIRDQYAAYGISDSYNHRIQVIEPGVYIPDVAPVKERSPLHILYAGRGGSQKRVWLIDRIATQLIKEQLPVQFHFAGTMMDELSGPVKAASVLHGQLTEPGAMQSLYSQCHVILMTSAYEGFPMFIKEGMAFGCIPVVTGLPGNKTHLTNGENALLLEPADDEEQVVVKGVTALKQLMDDEQLRSQLSNCAYQYARAHFDREAFQAAYGALLITP